MSITKSIAYALRNYKEANHLSMAALAAELGIAVSSLQSYMDGTANPRADTIELLAKKMCLSVIEIVSGPAPEWKQTEAMVEAAKEISGLPADRRAQGVALFLQLVALFAVDS